MTVDRTRESAIDSFESSGGLAQFVGEELNKKTNQRERNLPKDTELVFLTAPHLVEQQTRAREHDHVLLIIERNTLSSVRSAR